MLRTVPAVMLLTAISFTAPSAVRGQEAPRPSLPLDVVNERWTGDFGEMVKRRRIRLLTPYSRTHYFVDGGVQRGLDHLARTEVAVREGSSELEGLVALNEAFALEGKPPIVIRTLPRTLEDEDLLEMVHAGLLPATVVDEFTGRFWSQIFPQFSLHEGIVVRPNVAMAWAVRKGSPDRFPIVSWTRPTGRRT